MPTDCGTIDKGNALVIEFRRCYSDDEQIPILRQKAEETDDYAEFVSFCKVFCEEVNRKAKFGRWSGRHDK